MVAPLTSVAAVADPATDRKLRLVKFTPRVDHGMITGTIDSWLFNKVFAHS